MNQDSDSDYEQVFIINDTDDCSGDQHKPFSGSSRDSSSNNYNVSPEDTKKFLSNATPLAAVALVGFLTIFFLLSFIGIAFDLSPQHIGMMAFFSIMGLIVITLLSIQGDESDIVIAEETIKAENRSRNRGKKKKFNNIQEYRVSQEFQRDKAELASKQTSEEKNSQEDKDNIDIAIRALVSLGFKIKRATDLVSRALDSGISPKETQVLVRYALSNNNKA
jgi:hypothetical protein